MVTLQLSNLYDLKTLTEIEAEFKISLQTLRSRLDSLQDGVEYRKLGFRHPILLTPDGIEKLTCCMYNQFSGAKLGITLQLETLYDLKTLSEVEMEFNISRQTLHSRLNYLQDGIEYRKLGLRHPILLTPDGVKKLVDPSLSSFITNLANLSSADLHLMRQRIDELLIIKGDAV